LLKFLVHGLNIKLRINFCPPEGFATYRLILLNAPSSLAIEIEDVNTAYKLFANGEMIFQSGVVSKSPEKMVEQQLVSLIYLPVGQERIELILHVSNFIYYKAGIRRSPILGDIVNLSQIREQRLIITFLLSGACLMMGFYHLGLFWFRRRDISVLYLSYLSFCFSAMPLLLREAYLFHIFPDFDWVIFRKLAYLNLWFIIIFLTLFLEKLYEDIAYKKINKLIVFIGSTLSIISFFVSMKTYSMIQNPSRIIVFVIFIYLASITFRMYYLKKEYSSFVLSGTIIVIISLILDSLWGFGIIQIRELSLLGYLSLLFCYSLIFSNKFAATAIQIEDKNIQLQQLDKDKDQFLANTSHELRTPLNGIIGLADSLIDGVAGKLNSETLFILKTMSQSGRRLSSLVNEVLDFSKLKKKQLVLRKGIVNLHDFIESVLSLLLPLIEKKELKLINQVDQSYNVESDAERLEQIIFNLVGNAIKFTESGTVTIGAREVGKTIQIFVEDTGIGIPEGQFEKIFKSFTQVDGSTEREYGGTGLGLSLTKELVELHGGKIRIESVLGKGSKFSFALAKSSEKPIANDTTNIFVDKADEKISEVDSKWEVQHPRIRILIVDDEFVNRLVLKNQLKRLYSLETASGGEEALKKIQQQKPDLVLLDIMMPGMDGYKVCQIIREQFLDTQLPVIMVTAKVQTQDLIKGYACGANDYITKPSILAELMSRIGFQLSISSKYFELRQISEVANSTPQNIKEEVKILGRCFEQNPMMSQPFIVNIEENEILLGNPDMEELLLIKDFPLTILKDSIETYINQIGDYVIGASYSPQNTSSEYLRAMISQALSTRRNRKRIVKDKVLMKFLNFWSQNNVHLIQAESGKTTITYKKKEDQNDGNFYTEIYWKLWLDNILYALEKEVFQLDRSILIVLDKLQSRRTTQKGFEIEIADQKIPFTNLSDEKIRVIDQYLA